MKKLLSSFATLAFAAVLMFSGAAVAADPMTVRISAGPSGANNFMICATMADLVMKAFPNYTISVEISTGSQQNIRAMTQNNAQMGISMSDAALYSFGAEREFTDLPKGSVNYVIGGYPTVMKLMVAKDAPYKSFADLKGKKLGVGKGIMAQYYLPIMLEAYGMKKDDVKVTVLQLADLINSLADGTVDGIVNIIGFPVAVISDLAITKGFKLLEFDDAVVKGINEKYPYFSRMIIPGGTYQDIPNDTRTFGTMNTLICRADLQEEFVYNFVKTVIENTEHMASVSRLAGMFNKDNTMKGAVIPVHPGALKYYKEIGIAK